MAFRVAPCVLFVALLTSVSPPALMAVVTGSISGIVRDASGAVIPGVSVKVLNTGTGIVQTAETDSVGFYNFPALPVGHYDVSFEKSGFVTFRQTGLVIDVDTALRVDPTLQVGAEKQEVTVTAEAAQVDTRTTQNGEVISSTEMENLPLNGRAYTDLLALQPGVVPFNLSQYGTLSPSNSLNNGVLVMSGQRGEQNGFMVNGANTVEGNGGGTTVIPNLDSISEFRIILTNAGAEYGNYNGGQVNVVTKSGTNQFHGSAFEFVRNSDFDSRYFYSPDRGVLHQNQFGGTGGGPILRNKLFFFADYQGTRQVVGVDTGQQLVPSVPNKNGDFTDQAANIAANEADNPSTNTVSSAYFAGVLSSRLGYPVSAGEHYFPTPANPCADNTECVFPNFMIPQSAWDTPSANAVALIPDANQGLFYSTSGFPATLNDDKVGIRIDGNTRFGMISGYWHYDPWTNNQPYGPFAASTFPGFPIQTVGKAQLFTFGVTTNFGSNSVNQFTASYMRNHNDNGKPGTKGPTLQEIGFAPPDQGGIYQLEGPDAQNWPWLGFDHFGLGQYVVERVQDAETYQLQDDFTRIVGTHTLKFGGNYHWDHVPIAQVNNGGNSFFTFSSSTETGNDLANMLIGAPDYFAQGAPAALNLRNFYIGVYGEDSWRVRSNLTLNYGVRWETTPFWADRLNRNPDIQLGCQSKIFPTAPEGYCFPGDPGIPRYFINPRWNNFGPRLGLVYSPNFASGFLHTLFGDAGKSSIRIGFGTYYTNIEGANTFNFAAAPYSLYYPSQFPPLFSTPFISKLTGENFTNPFPLPVHKAGDTNIDWSPYLPFSGRQPYPNDPSPYAEHINVSIQRQLTPNTLLSLAYVGTFGHHLVLNTNKNGADPALCYSLSAVAGSQQAIDRGIPGVVDGTNVCGPGNETGFFYPATGGQVLVRHPFSESFSGLGAQIMAGNSAYHSAQVTLRRTTGRAAYLFSYVFSKSLDTGSGFGDQIIQGLDPNIYRALSQFDITHIFSASYTYELPFDRLFRANNRLTRGWKVAGVTTFTTGAPVSIYQTNDYSLRGNGRNSPQQSYTDEPMFLGGGPIYINKDPRKQYIDPNTGALVNPYFNPELFAAEPFGGQGNANRRFFHGPGVNNWNLAIMKDTRIRENVRLEFRAEFFNAFNHAQFYGNNNVVGNFNAGPSAFGGVFSAGNASRIGQLGGKLYF
ncbi:MAG: carboxypeptidase regulatory-like domain-containing protein [Terriglobia bacterium]